MEIEDQFKLMFQLLEPEPTQSQTPELDFYACKYCGAFELVYGNEGRTCLQCCLLDDEFDVMCAGTSPLENYHIQSKVPYKRKIYFMRKLRFLYGRQRVVIPKQLLSELQDTKDEYSIREYCRKNQQWKRFVRHSRKIYYHVNKIVVKPMPEPLQNMLLSMFCIAEENYTPFLNKRKFMNYNDFMRRCLCWIHTHLNTPYFPLNHLQYINALKAESSKDHNELLWNVLDKDQIFQYVSKSTISGNL